MSIPQHWLYVVYFGPETNFQIMKSYYWQKSKIETFTLLNSIFGTALFACIIFANNVTIVRDKEQTPLVTWTNQITGFLGYRLQVVYEKSQLQTLAL